MYCRTTDAANKNRLVLVYFIIHSSHLCIGFMCLFWNFLGAHIIVQYNNTIIYFMLFHPSLPCVQEAFVMCPFKCKLGDIFSC